MIGQRIRQFMEAGRGPDESDLALAGDWLSPELLELYLGQHPRDAAHTAATARWLLDRGEEDADLVRAAFLHDVGKGHQRRLDRVAFVLASALGIQSRLAAEGSRFELRRALYRSLHHAARGAAVLVAAGVGEGVVDLVRNHHLDPAGNDMLSLLEDADGAT